MLEFIVICTAFFAGYFLACNRLDRQEAEDGDQRRSFLWHAWFGYNLLVQGGLFALAALVQFGLDGYSIEVAATLVVGIISVPLALWVLKRGTAAWFIATVLSFNPLYWVVNTLYFLRVRACFGAETEQSATPEAA
ncbi:hypothetical protein [Ferrimonas balearica]|uniref:hypothetical protein n=1 Tax=Ferrimonas balearica TaxID=44012 RepID=UPI001C999330|nr:hypothetical protein [Ferrimonas balearica]MBY5992387.1 hypothetical protein [Ferrimonas balearica]